MTGPVAFYTRLATLPSAPLAELAEHATRQRTDRKHLVHVSLLQKLLAGLDPGCAVLDIGGRRAFGYRTVYFDTPDLACFHAHQQGRRRRYKVRTRQYATATPVVLEVKLRGQRDRTVKYRRPHPGSDPRRLDAVCDTFIGASIAAEYGLQPPAGLVPTLETYFTRSTLLGPGGDERLTVDVGLSAVRDGRRIGFDAGWAIVESKSEDPHPAMLRVLRALGCRPGPMSKYCLGIAAFHPHLPSNRWRPAQRRLAA